jgi:hypothetical protein
MSPGIHSISLDFRHCVWPAVMTCYCINFACAYCWCKKEVTAQARGQVELTPERGSRPANSTIVLTFSLAGDTTGRLPRRWQVPCVTDLTWVFFYQNASIFFLNWLTYWLTGFTYTLNEREALQNLVNLFCGAKDTVKRTLGRFSTMSLFCLLPRCLCQ